MSQERKPFFLSSLFRKKCPSCRKGRVFANKSIFPLGQLVKMVPYCDVCGQKMVEEQNNGGGINYALTVIVFMLNFVWYWAIFGMSYKDNSVETCLVVSTVIVLLLQPWLMRMSRILYLYFYVPYGKTRKIEVTENINNG
jgi:uncharacterized protein (DUF983 family)